MHMDIDPADHVVGATMRPTSMRSPAVVGMHTPISLVSTYRDITNATEMLNENEEVKGMDIGGEYEDYDDYYEDGEEEDGDDGGMDEDMVNQFVNGEENRKFRSTVWNEFVKIRMVGVVIKGQCKHCEALITARRGVGTSAMRTHLKRCKVRRTMANVVSQLNATIVSPQGVAMKDWKFSQ